MGTTDTETAVVGVFDDPRAARRAVDELYRAGFTGEQIGVAAGNRAVVDRLTGGTAMDDDESFAGEGTAIGVAVGAVLGLLWGLGVAAGTLPAAGQAITPGPVAAVFASAAAGAAFAGIAGAVVGWVIPEGLSVAAGAENPPDRIVVGVRTPDRADRAFEVLHDAHARFEFGTVTAV